MRGVGERHSQVGAHCIRLTLPVSALLASNDNGLDDLPWIELESRENWVLKTRKPPKGGTEYKTSAGYKLRVGAIPMRVANGITEVCGQSKSYTQLNPAR